MTPTPQEIAARLAALREHYRHRVLNPQERRELEQLDVMLQLAAQLAAISALVDRLAGKKPH
jgi:uncharacterized protein YjiS (DUF1127 family)